VEKKRRVEKEMGETWVEQQRETGSGQNRKRKRIDIHPT